MFRVKMKEDEIHQWMFISGVFVLFVVGLGAGYLFFGNSNTSSNSNTSFVAETCVVHVGDDSTTAYSVPGKKGDC